METRPTQPKVSVIGRPAGFMAGLKHSITNARNAVTGAINLAKENVKQAHAEAKGEARSRAKRYKPLREVLGDKEFKKQFDCRPARLTKHAFKDQRGQIYVYMTDGSLRKVGGRQAQEAVAA